MLILKYIRVQFLLSHNSSEQGDVKIVRPGQNLGL
jgi:hypothetical protein